MKATQEAPATEHAESAPAEVAGEPAGADMAFTAQGAIPPVAGGAQGQAGPTASELAFGGGPSGAVGAAGAGDGLPDDVRGKFESSLGADLSGVRVHTDDPTATAAGAKAVTSGQNVHMAPGQFDPHGAAGQQLLAHEVAHTVQQRGGAPQAQAKLERPAPSESAAEHEADTAASAMVAGQPARVSPVADARPHAKEYSRYELIAAYNASRDRQDWSDVALRLNGFGNDDITALVGKLSAGQLAHVREVTPAWATRVIAAIDDADTNASRIATLYAAYEKAVVAAKASGDWHEVIDRLNGMGDPDIRDRLSKLTWFDFEAMRAQTENKRILAALDKADVARVQRVYQAYQTALSSQNWIGVVAQLHAMSDDDIRAKLGDIASKPETKSFLKRIKEAAIADKRIVAILDDVAAANGEVVPTPIDTTGIVALPDVSDDVRPLNTIADFSSYAGNTKIAQFGADLAAAYNTRRAASGRTDKQGKGDTGPQAADNFADSFATTAKHYSVAIAPKMGLGRFAKQWMSEMRERADKDSGALLDYMKMPTNIDHMTFAQSDLQRIGNKFDDGEHKNKEGEIVIQGQRVHPFVNSFMQILGTKGVGFAASTYPNHGGSAEVAPFCLDVMPKIQLDSRGLYQPDQMVEFIEKIHATAGDGNWSGVYNDTAVQRELPKRGLAGKVGSTAVDGTHNFHGALNLHIHLYLRPPDGWTAAPDPNAAPKVDPKDEPKL